VLTAGALAALGLSACESTQDKSARLAHSGQGAANQSTLKLGAANANVHVARTAVLHAAGGNAVAVELRNAARSAEADVPVLIDVRDAHGKSLYKNDLQGLQPALQQMALVGGGRSAYWVNDQVLGAGTPRSVVVHVGRAAAHAPARVPQIGVEAVRLDHDSTGTFAAGRVVNRSALVQLNLPIFAVALRGGRVVAAGRAIVPRLMPAPTKKPTRFRIFFIGDPRGAQLRVTAVPTVLTKGA
jgi:hypothetical protein